MRSEFNIYVGGIKGPCGYASPGRSYYKMWAVLNRFDPRNDLVLNSVRIGMDCMNLVTVILRYTCMWVPITLTAVMSLFWAHQHCYRTLSKVMLIFVWYCVHTVRSMHF